MGILTCACMIAVLCVFGLFCLCDQPAAPWSAIMLEVCTRGIEGYIQLAFVVP